MCVDVCRFGCGCVWVCVWMCVGLGVDVCGCVWLFVWMCVWMCVCGCVSVWVWMCIDVCNCGVLCECVDVEEIICRSHEDVCRVQVSDRV